MLSKEESKNIRQAFWEGFTKYSAPKRKRMGKPKNWIMQNTGIKAVDLKFHIDEKMASVSIDVVSKSIDSRVTYWNKFLGLKTLLDNEFNQKLIWDDMYQLETGKDIIRIALILENVNIFEKSCWPDVYKFFFVHMIQLEDWLEYYKDIIKVNQQDLM